MSVERDESGIHVHYDIVPPPGVGSHRPQGEAKNDLGNDYHPLGGHFGLTGDRGSTDTTRAANTRARGRVTMPIPLPAATMLRIRIDRLISGTLRRARALRRWCAPHRPLPGAATGASKVDAGVLAAGIRTITT
jgi:hypothetical protein